MYCMCCPQAVSLPLKISQTAAIMEVVHAAAGIVRSPVGITGMLWRVKGLGFWNSRVWRVGGWGLGFRI